MYYSHCEHHTVNYKACQVGGVVTRLPAEQFYACSIQAPGLFLLEKPHGICAEKMQILSKKCHKKR